MRMFLVVLLLSLIFGWATAHAEIIPPAHTIASRDVEAAVAEALSAKGAGERVQAYLLGGNTGTLYAGPKDVQPRVTGLTYDVGTRRWSANVLLMEGEQVISAAPASGRFETLVSLPVLTRQVRGGETIRAEDVVMQDVPQSRTRSDFVTDLAALEGKSPRAVISAGRPIRAHEVRDPAVLKKNAIVTLTYKTGVLSITSTGQALAEGAKADVIEVRNLMTKAVLRGVVENAQHVSIPSASQVQASASGGAYEKN